MLLLPAIADSSLHAPLAVQAVVGVVGVILLLWGARVYKAGLFLASFGAGAVGVVALLAWGGEHLAPLRDPWVLLPGALVGGLVTLSVAAFAHRLALIGVGAVTGAALLPAGLGALVPLVPTLPPPPWWVGLIGALGGAVLLPWLFPTLLKVLTPAVGAVLLAWAVGQPGNPVLLLAAWTVGALVQLVLVRRRPRREQAAA